MEGTRIPTSEFLRKVRLFPRMERHINPRDAVQRVMFILPCFVDTASRGSFPPLGNWSTVASSQCFNIVEEQAHIPDATRQQAGNRIMFGIGDLSIRSFLPNWPSMGIKHALVNISIFGRLDPPRRIIFWVLRRSGHNGER